jgi:23S rRNA pseudouridine2605 synthase
MALERAAAGKKVVPKKRLPEFSQLKAPARKKAKFGRLGPGGGH